MTALWRRRIIDVNASGRVTTKPVGDRRRSLDRVPSHGPLRPAFYRNGENWTWSDQVESLRLS